jgi:hypothetical protein
MDMLKPDIQTIQMILLYTSNGEKWELESHHWVLTSIAVKMVNYIGGGYSIFTMFYLLTIYRVR